jgi:hypothetical protein
VRNVIFDDPSALEELAPSCFNGSKLERIHLPPHVRVLPKGCFEHCTALGRVTFAQGSRLRQIGETCFAGCRLETFVLPRSCEIIEASAFSGARIVALLIEDGSCLTDVGPFAFSSCLCGALTIPHHIPALAGSVLAAGIFKDFRVDGHPRLAVENGCLFDRADSRLVRPLGQTRTVLVWKDVRVLGAFCFYETISSIWKLGGLQFEGDSSLVRIEESCFQACSLKEIVIPRSVEVLGKEAFRDSMIERIAFQQNYAMRQIDEACFTSSLLTGIMIPKGVEELPKSCFASCSRLKAVSFEAGTRVKVIGESCFRLSGATALIIPKSVEVLSNQCFLGAKLATLTFEAGSVLKHIGDACAARCPRGSSMPHRQSNAWPQLHSDGRPR